MVLLCVDLLQVPHHILKAVVVPFLHVLLGATMSNILSVLSKAMLGNEKPLNIIHLVPHMLYKLLNIGGTSPSPTYARVQGHFPVIFQTNHLHSVPVKTTIASSGAILVLDAVVETKAENRWRSVPSSEITE